MWSVDDGAALVVSATSKSHGLLRDFSYLVV
jgi:hypothetical protein